MSDAQEVRTIAALAAACFREQGAGRHLLTEEFLSRLLDREPNVARIVASALRATGDSKGQKLGEAVHDRAGEFSGSSLTSVAVGLDVDYLILTVKKIELQACLRVFDFEPGAKPVALGSGLEAWTTAVDGCTFAIAMVGTAGNVESALRLGGLATLIRAKASLLLGMAAGVRGEIDIGDVVVAEQIIAFEFQRMTPQGPIYQPRTYSPLERHISKVELLELVSPGWARSVCSDLGRIADREDLPRDSATIAEGRWSPRVHRGAVLAGSKLIEDGSIPSLAARVNGRTLAAEMEGAGFAAACGEHNFPWLVVRGVSDHGENPRPVDWQFAASYAAARFIRDGLRLGRIDFS